MESSLQESAFRYLDNNYEIIDYEIINKNHLSHNLENGIFFDLETAFGKTIDVCKILKCWGLSRYPDNDISYMIEFKISYYLRTHMIYRYLENTYVYHNGGLTPIDEEDMKNTYAFNGGGLALIGQIDMERIRFSTISSRLLLLTIVCDLDRLFNHLANCLTIDAILSDWLYFKIALNDAERKEALRMEVYGARFACRVIDNLKREDIKIDDIHILDVNSPYSQNEQINHQIQTRLEYPFYL